MPHTTPLQPYPDLPEKLDKLRDLMLNLRYSWDPHTVDLFEWLDKKTWRRCDRNPVRALSSIPFSRLQKVSNDEGFIAELDAAWRALQEYKGRAGWFEKQFPAESNGLIAYFSAEYGLDTGLPIYSGGLGVLSGDHLKSSSDLGLPLIAVGLLYRCGYFHQSIASDGQQIERYVENDWRSMPVSLVLDEDGRPFRTKFEVGGHDAYLRIWKAEVGHVTLYLLDTNLQENDDYVRETTSILYPADKDLRLRQEITLGIGGAKALFDLGITPGVFHMNEGHSMFLVFERIRLLMKHDFVNFEEASELVRATTLFTTHTPVPAGNEVFDPALLEPYLRPYAESLGISWERWLGIGRSNPGDNSEWFSMTIAALKSSRYANGVSELHGQVSRDMWKHVWPESPVEKIPIGSVTNGVHPRTWIAPSKWRLYEAHVGPEIETNPADFEVWDRVQEIPGEHLWGAHQQQRQKLVRFIRRRHSAQMTMRGESSEAIEAAERVLDENILTIGFARRFATYKRGDLIFSDIKRLERILLDENQPAQLVIAGKAHPNDAEGQAVIKRVFDFARSEELRQRVVFLEDYDITVARYLVSGCDLWLNNPRRPEEASGTSGMKAAFNGGLNFSVLDGWWAEGYSSDLGWVIGSDCEGRIVPPATNGDELDAESLYATLQTKIVPLFYERDDRGLPLDWIEMMKRSIVSVGREFSSHRMVEDYASSYYEPALTNFRNLTANDYRELRVPKAAPTSEIGH